MKKFVRYLICFLFGVGIALFLYYFTTIIGFIAVLLFIGLIFSIGSINKGTGTGGLLD